MLHAAARHLRRSADASHYWLLTYAAASPQMPPLTPCFAAMRRCYYFTLARYAATLMPLRDIDY